MKNFSIIAFMALVSSSAFAVNPTPCAKEVTDKVQGSNMYQVVTHVAATRDGATYVVIFHGDSGDAEQASQAIVYVDPSSCKVTGINWMGHQHY